MHGGVQAQALLAALNEGEEATDETQLPRELFKKKKKLYKKIALSSSK